jgi:hypothetical protein
MKDFGAISRHKWALPLEAAMAVGVIVTFARGDWHHFSISLFTLVVSFLPLLIERFMRVRLPSLFQVMYVAFIFLSMFSGEVLAMYERVGLWDDAVHISSGLLIGTCAAVFTRTSREHIRMSAWTQAVFVFGIVTSLIVLWEIVEFASDQLFGTYSQGASLVDTMSDLVDGTVGGLIIAIVLVVHLTKKRIQIFDTLVHTYEKLN